MTLRQTERLLALLKANGVTHYKSGEVEIILEASVPQGRGAKDNSRTQSPKPPMNPSLLTRSVVPAQAAPPVASNIPHHTNEVASLLRLDDAALVDRLFPDYTQHLPE